MPDIPLPEQNPSDAAVPPGADTEPRNDAVPGRGHKAEILEDTIATLKGQESQDLLVQKTRGWIDRIAAMAHAGVDKVASTATSAAGAAAGATTAATAKAQDLQQTASTAKDQWLDDARAAVQARPLAALGIAVLAGMALSVFLSSGTSDDQD